MADTTKNDLAYIQLEKELKLLNLQYSELYSAYRMVGNPLINGGFEIRDIFNIDHPSHPILKNVVPAIQDLQLYCEDIHTAWKKVQKRQKVVRQLIEAYHNGENLIQARLRIEDDE